MFVLNVVEALDGKLGLYCKLLENVRSLQMAIILGTRKAKIHLASLGCQQKNQRKARKLYMGFSGEKFFDSLKNELDKRGYENCSLIDNPWLPKIIAYTDTFGCQYSIMCDDDQRDVIIIVSNICDGDESEMHLQMAICNNFNNESRYARFFCTDSGGIIVHAEVSCATENLIQICADVFEIVAKEVSALVDYLFSK